MARTAKPGTGNGFDRDMVKSFVDRVDELEDEIGSIMGTAMNECKQRRGDIKEVLTEAKDKGIPLKPLKAEIRLRKLDRDKAKVVAGLEQEDAESLEMIQAALGEFASTPLGQAALSAAA